MQGSKYLLSALAFAARDIDQEKKLAKGGEKERD